MKETMVKNLRITYTKTKRIFMQRCFSEEPIAGPVLEIGSGRDKFNRMLFVKKYKVVTSNIYPKNVVDYICSVNCFPFKDNKFGCVICEHVLEHVEEPAKAIDEIKRVLKPKGLLILIVPFSWPIHEKPYDLWRFSEEGLRHLLMIKFENVKFDTIGSLQKPVLICVTARKSAHEKQKLEHPKVSVIMPTYNRADRIGKSIESVLNQTFKNWELIIVSDGSADNTPEVIKKYKDSRIIFLEKKHGGPSLARNFGLKHARGEYITYCDDDDVLFPYHLETLTGYLDRHPEVGVIMGGAVQVFENKKNGYLKGGLLWTSMHKQKLLKKIGFFDKRFWMWEDVDFLLRLYDCGKGTIFESILTKHIIHRGGMGVTYRDQHTHWQDLMCAKRVRKVFKEQKIDQASFILLAAIIFHKPGPSKTILALSKVFYSQHPGIQSVYLMGLSYYIGGNIAKSIECMRKVLIYKSKQNNAGLRENLRVRKFAFALMGILYTHKRQYSLSIRYLQQGIGCYPKCTLLKVELFHVFLEGGRKDLAEELLERNKDKKITSYMRGVLFLYQKEYLKAKEHLKKSDHIDKILRYRLYSSLYRLYSIIGKKDYASKYRVKSWEYKKETYFAPLLNKKLLSVGLSYLGILIARIFLLGGQSDSHRQII